MSRVSHDLMLYGGIAAAILIIGPMIAKSVAQGAVNAAGTIATDAAAGAVIGAGQVIGVPETNMTQCQMDMAAGHTWDASFSCPASDFFHYLKS